MNPLSVKNLTQLEIPVLPEKFNLTDGHVHRSLTPTQEKIVDRLPELFRRVSREQQPELERHFIDVFYRLAGQTVDLKKTRYLLCTSASMSIELVANYLRLNQMGLSLLEPCFDNLADIFKRHGIERERLPEAWLLRKDFSKRLEGLDAQAVCVITPNNPTGVTLDTERFHVLAEHCKKKSKLLIVDASFRFYNPDNFWDQYKLLNDLDVDYVFIEDTGKTWPTHEQKLSILAVSQRLFKPLYGIYTECILHVSPFTLALLTEFIKNAQHKGLKKIHESVLQNRKALTQSLEGTFLTPTEKGFSSVAWLRIENELTAIQLHKFLDKHGVHILPGNQFFWKNPEKGNKYIRVSLARDPPVFEKAVQRMGFLCREVGK